MRSHWSLVGFTLLVQSAVGSVWCLQAALFPGGGRLEISFLKLQVFAALCAVVLGQAVALAHLGRPRASFHAVQNLKRSWLSREILSVHVFAGVLVILVILSQIRPWALNGWLMLLGSLAGGLALYAMTRVYRLRTVRSWNHAGIPLNFLGSALLLGGLQFILVLTMRTGLQSPGHDASGTDIFRNIAFIAVIAGFLLKVLAASMNSLEGTSGTGPIKTSLPVMQGVGSALFAIYALSAGSTGFQAVFLSLAALSLIAGEIIHRVRFYNSYQSFGL
jgi:Tat-targeted selenate reductase subunit YnfH